MPKRLILVLVAVVFFLSFHSVFASLIINEIMYNPQGADTDHEWIEVYNNSSTDSVDLTGDKFNDGSNHGLNQPPANGGQGSLVIPAGGYAILSGNAATFLSDHSGFSGTVIDTVMNLPNTSAMVQILKSDNSVISAVTYNSSQGADEDGNSLQLINGSWAGATPTPGTANLVATSASASAGSGGNGPLIYNYSDGNTSSSVTATTETKTKVVEVPKIKTKITAKALGFVGLPNTFQAVAYGLSGEQLHFGKYFWNFGDGDSKEINLADSQPFTHSYFYPGDYLVSLDYYSTYYQNYSDASDQITIKIIPADISISKVGDEKDFFVELSNNTDYDANISNWVLASEGKSFTIPRNTILLPNKKIIISPKITGFSIADQDTLKLMTSEGEVAFDYSKIQQGEPLPKTTPSIPPPKEEVINSSNFSLPLGEGKGGVYSETIIPTENLTSSVVSSDVVKNNSASNPLAIVASLVFVGAGASAVYFIRRKKIIPQAGNDFEILDE